jgi:hypothetical protein
MSIVATRPPRLAPTQTTYGSRRLYTLHSNPNDVFAWRIDDQRVKTATVAFRRRGDAALMAYMIERHVKQEKSWPDVLVVDNAFSLFGGKVNPMQENSLIEVRSWNMDSLQVFCVDAYLDLIVLNELGEQQNSKYKLSGDVIKLSVPDEYYALKIAELYARPSFVKEPGLDDE